MVAPTWCHTLNREVFDWLMSLREPGGSGQFRFCREGALVFPGPTTGLDASALALKICYMIGGLSRIRDADLAEWSMYIRSYQKAEEPGLLRNLPSGFFMDPVFVKHADRQCRLFRKDFNIRRAVSRQACAALLCAGQRPDRPVLCIPGSEVAVSRFLTSLDWNNDPWGAGSQMSHLVFFLDLNSRVFGMSERCAPLIDYVFRWIDQIRNSETGSWYIGDPTDTQKINAAMKVLTAYAVVNRPLENAERLIDFALDSRNDEDGCNNADVLFVLYYCHLYSRHRYSDICTYCRKRISIIEQFRRDDGGFSFNRNAAQSHLWGVQVSKGLPESDIHGTTLFLWSLAMIATILKIEDSIALRMPVN